MTASQTKKKQWFSIEAFPGGSNLQRGDKMVGWFVAQKVQYKVRVLKMTIILYMIYMYIKPKFFFSLLPLASS